MVIRAGRCQKISMMNSRSNPVISGNFAQARNICGRCLFTNSAKKQVLQSFEIIADE